MITPISEDEDEDEDEDWDVDEDWEWDRRLNVAATTDRPVKTEGLARRLVPVTADRATMPSPPSSVSATAS
jgi:hypothetical protein